MSKNEVTVPDRVVEVQGFVRPYVAGQTVKVQSYLGRKLIKTDVLRVKPAKGGVGAFTEKVKASAAGLVRVKVTHDRTPQMLGFEAVRAFTVLDPQAGFGAHGLFVTLIQQRLAALHVFVPQTGVYDTYTGLALDAYHRLLGHGFSQSPGRGDRLGAARRRRHLPRPLPQGRPPRRGRPQPPVARR